MIRIIITVNKCTLKQIIKIYIYKPEWKEEEEEEEKNTNNSKLQLLFSLLFTKNKMNKKTKA